MKRLKSMLVIALALACGHAAAQDLLWDDVQRLPAYRDRAAYLSCKTRGAVVDYGITPNAVPTCVYRTGAVIIDKDKLGPAVRMTLQEVVDVHWPSRPPGKVPVAVGVIPSQVGLSHDYGASRERVWVAVRYRVAEQAGPLTANKTQPANKVQPKTPAGVQWREGPQK